MSATQAATQGQVMEIPKDWKPTIIVFCCNWCSYAGADLAGVSRLQMPPYFRVIRTMCSARVDPEFVIRAFSKGVDGIVVAGCHPADCHYISGNYRTRRRMSLLKMLIQQYGFDKRRLQLTWISAGEGEKFQHTIADFTKTIQELGPNPLSLEVKRKKEGGH